MLEKMFGPVAGFYIASLVTPSPCGAYSGRFKLFVNRPVSFAESSYVGSGESQALMANAAAAAHHAEALGLQEVLRMHDELVESWSGADCE